MSSLDARFIQHLRQRAKDTSVSPSAYLCTLCKQHASFADSDAFLEHVDVVHAKETDQLRKDPNFDHQVWRDSLQTRAQLAAKSSKLREPEILETGTTAGLGLNRLTLEGKPHRDEPNIDRIRPGDDPGGGRGPGRGMPSSHEGQAAQLPSQQGGRNPRRVVQRDHGHAQQRGTPDPPQQRPVFKPHFDKKGRLLSRELYNPAQSDASNSQATLASRAVQPLPSTAQGSDQYLRQQSSLSRGPNSGSMAQTSSSVVTGPEAWPQQQSSSTLGSNLGASGVQLFGPSRQHERGIFSLSSEFIAQRSVKERGVITMPVDPRFPDMLMQPDSRPISQEQLSAEVKSIYAGLVMVESKCIHVDKAQASAIRGAEKGEAKIADDHWQALIALHRTLLHEHHDFFLASQHPSASPALRRLATKYTMPARMWKHGIHSFLELLRYRLPDSLEFMISFIYTAYQMMSLLYETVPAFEDTWIECLGDLGRYRMAIEDEDIRDRETWAGVARFWYSKAADRSPEVGRLYHHLAILARPNGLQQLYLYSRSLTSVQIFHSARESILTLFNPLLGRSESSSTHLSKIDTFFIKIHAYLFMKEQLQDVDQQRKGFLDLLDGHIGRVTAKWREHGAYVIIANISALYDYGTESPLRRLFELGSKPPSPTPESSVLTLAPFPDPDSSSQLAFAKALDLSFLTSTIVLHRIGDKNVLPYVHILLSFLSSLASIQDFDFEICGKYVASSIFQATPWSELCSYINTLARAESDARYESIDFIQQEKGDARPLPEDHIIRGQIWSQKSFPDDWYIESEVDDEERSIEHASTVRVRTERVLWLAYRLASYKKWIQYDTATKTWTPIPLHPTPTPIIESEDVDMIDGDKVVFDDPDYVNVSEDDSPEMKELNEEERHRASARSNAGRLDVPSGGSPPLESAMAMLKHGYTVMVCDETLLLEDQEFFNLLVERRWTIVVPHYVFTRLSKSAQADSTAAQIAVKSVQDAFTMKKDVRILTAKGVDITETELAKSASEGVGNLLENADSLEENIVQVARRATDLSLEEKPQDASNRARSAILLTDDRLTRVRAARNKVAAITPSKIKRILTATRRRASSGHDRPTDVFRNKGTKQATGPPEFLEQ